MQKILCDLDYRELFTCQEISEIMFDVHWQRTVNFLGGIVEIMIEHFSLLAK